MDIIPEELYARPNRAVMRSEGIANPRLLTELSKLYHDDKKKYTGEQFDGLDGKLQIFYEQCRMIGLEEEEYEYAMLIFLKDRAAAYYYDFIAPKKLNFESMITLMRQHFETEETVEMY